jgi:putative endonuclease
VGLASPFWWERTRFLRFGPCQALEIAGEGERRCKQTHRKRASPSIPLAFSSRPACIYCMLLTVYILLCADGSYYVGSTKKPVETRVLEHNEGIYDGYTALRRPVVLVYTETFDRLTGGFARERQLKGWSREKKQRLIAGWHESLPPVSGRGTVKEKLERPSRRPQGGPPQDEGH